MEQTHFGKPATRYASALVSDPVARGFGEGTKRYGLLLGKGLDLEWAFAGGTLYLLQCRAMTRNR